MGGGREMKQWRQRNRIGLQEWVVKNGGRSRKFWRWQHGSQRGMEEGAKERVEVHVEAVKWALVLYVVHVSESTHQKLLNGQIWNGFDSWMVEDFFFLVSWPKSNSFIS